MAVIPFSGGGFSKLPEGIQVLYISKVEYKEDFGKLNIYLQNKNGAKHIEKYNLKYNNGDWNTKAIGALKYLCMNALNDFTMTQVDTDKITGHYFRANVVYVPSSDGSTNYINLAEKAPASSFDDDGTKPKYDLNAMLGLDDE